MNEALLHNEVRNQSEHDDDITEEDGVGVEEETDKKDEDSDDDETEESEEGTDSN